MQKIYAHKCAKRNDTRYLRTGRIYKDGNEAVHLWKEKEANGNGRREDELSIRHSTLSGSLCGGV